MLARSARASRHAAQRLGSGTDLLHVTCTSRSIGAPPSLNPSLHLVGKRSLNDAVRCSSTLAGRASLIPSHRGNLGSAASLPTNASYTTMTATACTRYPREIRSPLLFSASSDARANLYLHASRYQPTRQVRSNHSMVPASSLIGGGRSPGSRNVTDVESSLQSSFERTMQNIIMRAMFSSSSSSRSSPQMQPIGTKSDTDEDKVADEKGSPPSAKASAAAVNGSPPEAPAAAMVTEKKKPKAPREMAVHHATATDAFVSLVKSVPEKTRELIVVAAKALASILAKTPGVMWYYLTHPLEFRDKLVELKEAAKKEAHHYWMGSKLLAADLRTARQMLKQALQGTPLTRRERKQLLRTVSDVFRLVPMSIFVLIPFMEFALPFALKIFPNMLPSTFQDSLKAEENMKRELKMRLNMAEFFQE